MNNTTTAPPSFSLPNPYTPLAWLPPKLAFDLSVSIYIFVGTAGAMTWDFLINLSGDLFLIFGFRISLTTVVYWISRLSTLGFVLATAIYTTARTGGQCDTYEDGFSTLFPLSISSTSLLFFLRLRAVYGGNRWVSAFFGFSWLVVVAGTMTAIFSVTGGRIGNTNYCMTVAIKSYAPMASIVPLVNDTLVFLAIAWKLTQNSLAANARDGVKTFIFGKYLPRFSRALLKDGQIYYLTMVVSNLITLIMLYAPVPATYRVVFSIPNIALMNIMACRVYRNIKLGCQHCRSGISLPLIFGSTRPANPQSTHKTELTNTTNITDLTNITEVTYPHHEVTNSDFSTAGDSRMGSHFSVTQSREKTLQGPDAV